MKYLNYIIFAVLFIGGGALLLNRLPAEKGVISSDDKLTATVYKSPTCGCCVGYSGALQDHGMNVNIVSIDDMDVIKEEHNIPKEMESCHTTVIGGYFIEGHVPFEVVDKLLAEKPSIDGIALPNMPAGTPGMPGIKTKPYTVYQLIDGEYSEYITI